MKSHVFEIAEEVLWIMVNLSGTYRNFYGSDYMPSYLLVIPYASGSGGNPVSGISLNDGDDVNIILLGRVCAR